MASLDAQLLKQVLNGDRRANREFERLATPLIQRAVAQILYRCWQGDPSLARQQLADLVQDVYICLWENDQKKLRDFNPTRGPLPAFVKLIAKQTTITRLRTKRTDPRTHISLDEDLLAKIFSEATENSAEQDFLRRDLLNKAAAQLTDQLEPAKLSLFRALMVEQTDDLEALAQQHQTSIGNLQQHRSRFKQKLQAVLKRLGGSSKDE